MTIRAADILFARLNGFEASIAQLVDYYRNVVSEIAPTPYKDNGVSYVGWALTSRDGTVADGVKQISLSAKGATGSRGTTPTKVCVGYSRQVLEELEKLNIRHYRARLMRLENEGTEMTFHRDATLPTWRLHVPIITNPQCFLEWKLDDGRIERVHLPADGAAWLVRVDVLHRAVNQSAEPSERVHMLMSLAQPPRLDQLHEPWLFIGEAPKPADPLRQATPTAETRSSAPPYPDWSRLSAVNRGELLRTLPQDGVIAEVGVAKGEFSRRIFDAVSPHRLHLIDPWIHQELPLWRKRSTDYHFDSMRSVQQSFESEIRERRVLLHQGFSLDILPLFPAGYFDWVYLDGDHRFETVRQELELCDSRVKPDGLILGHDFIKPEFYPESERARLGVVPAVRDFCQFRNWDLVFQTPDQPRGSKQCPTFVLRRRR